MLGGPVSDAPTMVLCAGCADAVAEDARCPTCGEADPLRSADRGPDALDEALLDRVGVALAAQAALARRTAAKHVETATQLFEETVLLRGRLRTQAALLRARVAECKPPAAGMDEALDRVKAALDHADGLDRCGDAWTMTARLPRSRNCAAVARRLLEEYARRELGGQLGDDALLVSSELATNAFVHGDGAITLTVCRQDDGLRIELRDQGHDGRIEVVPEEERDDHGHGLWIVEQLASDWGADQREGYVWAELALANGL